MRSKKTSEGDDLNPEAQGIDLKEATGKGIAGAGDDLDHLACLNRTNNTGENTYNSQEVTGAPSGGWISSGNRSR